ncbi:MAG: cytosine permease [Verrucomicrobia bacterium]|nr:cytosine permease [Verrucomicrobiota bacterium]
MPSYITSATPLGQDKRAPWFKNVAPTYAGIFLWFVFWQDAAKAGSLGGTLSQGIGVALLGLVLAALICHFLFYVVPGLLGMKTGLPLYIVGTSTFGAQGGFIMPGFLMGVLQFGWLGVNVFFSAQAVGSFFDLGPASTGVKVIMVIWGVLAAFVGLKGIQYVAKVSTYLPLIPLAILLAMLVKTLSGLGSFNPQTLVDTHKTLAPTAAAPLSAVGVIALMLTYVVGFFATAGAAGVDIAMSTRNDKDVKMGGYIGIALAILVTAGISILVVAGVYGSTELTAKAVAAGTEKKGFILDSFSMISVVMGKDAAKWMMFLLALAAFPPACFSSFIAANSFKTTLPQVNPFISVGIGAAVSIILAITGLAGDAIGVFVIIGASFGPICGAMMVDYLLSDGKWTGPRAGFNPAGWIAWALGFVVGILPNLKIAVPAAPVAAFVVGAVVYFLCAKMGMMSQLVPLPAKK